MGLRQNEPVKGQWFTPSVDACLKMNGGRTGSSVLQKLELGLKVNLDDFELMGVWDHFYENSAIDESVSTHYVNLPHVCRLESRPELSLDAQHESVRWFDIPSISKDTGHQIYMREYATG